MVLGLGRQHAFQLVFHRPRHAIRHRLALHHDRAIGVEVDDSTLVQGELMPIGILFVIDNIPVGGAQLFSPVSDVHGALLQTIAGRRKKRPEEKHFRTVASASSGSI